MPYKPKAFKKVPKDALEEWQSLTDTLVELSALLEKESEAIVNCRRLVQSIHSRDLPKLDGTRRRPRQLGRFAARFDTLEELLAQLVLLASEISDRSEKRAMPATDHRTPG